MNTLTAVSDFLRRNGAREVLVLTDRNVDALYPQYLSPLAETWSCHKIVVPAGESSKSIEQATAIWEEMLDRQYDREVVVLNFGGGMICDLGGFVAATYKRGVRYVNLPTTLLAMIDAAVGGKTAVNHHYTKNCIGVFRQPDFIAPADTQFLDTLPHPELLSGFGEMLKYALISSHTFFQELEQLDRLTPGVVRKNWIDACVRFKESRVSADFEDRGARRVLNFGHTYGHAYESWCAAQGDPVPHGVAVAVGMVIECRLSAQAGILPQEELERIEQLVRRHFVMPDWNEALRNRLLPYLAQDKKVCNGAVTTIPLRHIGLIGQPRMLSLNDGMTLSSMK